jgi:hypothetical protein
VEARMGEAKGLAGGSRGPLGGRRKAVRLSVLLAQLADENLALPSAAGRAPIAPDRKVFGLIPPRIKERFIEKQGHVRSQLRRGRRPLLAGGDILMLDNFLASNGREPFEGPRKILVTMAELYTNPEIGNASS